MTGTAEQVAVWLMRQGNSEALYDIKLHKEKRSLDQNAYYWKLNALLARKLRISTARLHNLMLRECAPPLTIDGRVAMQPIPDTDSAFEKVLESETYHLRPTSGTITGNDKMEYRWYVVLRGSHTFNTAEMSALLDRLIEDCKEQGIETLTPMELQQMRAIEYARENKKNRDSNESKVDSLGT